MGELGQSDKTTSALLRIWKLVSGVEALEPSTTVESFGDSLMAILVSSMIKKQLGKDITVETLQSCERIEDQARAIESLPPVNPAAALAAPRRQGPPLIGDVVHVEGKNELFEQTKSLTTKELDALECRLTWDDVEDIIPLPDTTATLAHRTRNVSWNLRFVYSAPCDLRTLETAVKRSIENHPTLRSIAVIQNGKTLLVPVRVSEKWWRASLTTGHELDSAENLKTLLLDDPQLDAAAAPGPLTKIHLAGLKDRSSGLVMIASHSVNDQTSMRLWMEDVATGITQASTPLAPHVAFKEFAAVYQTYRRGDEAARGVAYWTQKLHGVSSLPESTFWPPQCAPEFMKGIDPVWSHWDGTPLRKGERAISFDEKRRAQKGVRRMAKIQDIARLKSVHGIPSFMLAKAAMALMNVHFSGGKEALFGTFNAARSWPFHADYPSAVPAGNPLDIAGPTVAVVCDRIPVPRHMPILDFLQHVTRDEVQNSSFAHAPFYAIADRLRDPLGADDTRTYLERKRDADALLPLIRRQVFNWLPPAMGSSPGYTGLNMLEMLPRMDNGATLSGCLAPDRKSVALGFMWDAEHLSLPQAEAAIDFVAKLVEAMGKEENWGLKVSDFLRM